MALLHERVAPDLLRYLERVAGSREDAADLLAETFLTAWRHRDRIPPDDEDARMWMFVTARHVSSNWRRGNQRRVNLSNLLRDELATAAPPRDETTPEVLDTRAAVAALPANLREIVTLMHWDGFTVPEAARITGIRESTARGRYQRARAQLRVALGRSEADPVETLSPHDHSKLRSTP
ncbi:RNA polymerase sigma factor [Marisediminicola sp. LYQ134]|uniref:RNA polymerase sigma factor n=1 Tax=Marisediminicola sp. LYQ134 TaxID=3391061 RepID=UPI003983A200